MFCSKRERKPVGFWCNLDNQKERLNDVAALLKIEDVNEWTRIRPSVFEKSGGKPVLEKYDSYYHMLQSLYPDQCFRPLQFHSIPRPFIQDPGKHKEILDELQERIWIRKPEQWFCISRVQLRSFGIESLVRHYGGLLPMLEKVYPDIDWNLVKKHSNLQVTTNLMKGFWENRDNDNQQNSNFRLPQGYWNSIENQREFLDYVANKFDIKSDSDWSKVTTDDIRALGGRQLLRKYPSFFDALKEIYPEKELSIDIARQRVPQNYWSEIENQRNFLEKFREDNGLENIQDLKNVSVVELNLAGASRMLRFYNSYIELLRTVYPEETWNEIEFKYVPRGHWCKRDNIIAFLEGIKEKYKITKLEDWYRISDLQIKSSNGAGLLRKYGSKNALLEIAYPDYNWNKFLLSKRDKRSAQRWLFLQVQELFPGLEIIEDYILHISRESKISVELDVFIPKYNLALEYQGEHHFRDIPAFGNIEMYTARDREKIELCTQADIKIIHIPFWWDEELESLKKMISDEVGEIWKNVNTIDEI